MTDPDFIRIRGACQHNLQSLDVDFALRTLTVVTGVSGSGKSSLVFDTLYAEGQRRYVETFSPYARQFLERMDKPRVGRIDGILPAIAIDPCQSVSSARSTVGTLTELADHFRLLYAHHARLHCRQCGKPVERDTAASIAAQLRGRPELADRRCLILFSVPVPAGFSAAEIGDWLARQGYARLHAQAPDRLWVVQDRFRLAGIDEARLMEALEQALQRGQGRLTALFVAEGETPADEWPFSTDLHCAPCDLAYAPASPARFSFNSPIGACETCRGFGRVLELDLALVVPDPTLSLREGAIRPWQTDSYRECQDDLEKMAVRDGIPLDCPFAQLTPAQRQWVFEGDPAWRDWRRSWPGIWYGVRRFFEWLETKTYKMHIRVLLSRYRSDRRCPDCGGSRLKPEAALWRLGDPALTFGQAMDLPIDRLMPWVAALRHAAGTDPHPQPLFDEIVSRLGYLQAVGLGYLTLSRASRTLSGGELQRINLTAALGTALTHTLFVLDEPSIGLHPRDIGRIVGVMQRLRDAGNTLVVVEHDPQIMLAADRLLEIGPGPGERGGRLVADAAPAALLHHPDSTTAAWLAGRRSFEGLRSPRPPGPHHAWLRLRGVRHHNLRALDLDLPLGCLVAVCGVSGSGKSTLIEDVLHPALAHALGQDEPGQAAPGERLAALEGHAALAAVVLVDQRALGKRARSNPVSYIGAWDAIRQLFAALPQAREQGCTAGTFSFNAGNGRCPQCGGSGFEHVQMQFLADVFLRCPACDGQRYRPEVLGLRWEGLNVADVLDLTVTQAIERFAAHPKIVAALRPLVEVGLDYLRLGQPVPTLSGGEAQRLKLAAHLSVAGRKGGAPTLFLFDEPTTGLHFEDIARLLAAFGRLLAAGHSVVVIEHNLDLLAQADWLIELGPEGGENGGRLVACGAPASLSALPASATGQALADYRSRLDALRQHPPPSPVAAEAPASAGPRAIRIAQAREHNLQDLSLELPHHRLNVITGLSGSGKSTLAFDIVFGEGQRRYLDSLNAYARQFVQGSGRPDVGSVSGIAPTVAIAQRTSRGGQKSTVATLTEIHPFLRILYTRLGTAWCPCCDRPVSPQSPAAIVEQIGRRHAGQPLRLLAPLVLGRKGLYTELARWARSKGYTQLRVDGHYLPTRGWPRLDRYREHHIELPVAELQPTGPDDPALGAAVAQALEQGRGVLHVRHASDEGEAGAPLWVASTVRACPQCGLSLPEPDPRAFAHTTRQGWCPGCYGTGRRLLGAVEDPFALDEAGSERLAETPCPDCQGERLNPAARAVRLQGRRLPQLLALPVGALAPVLDGWQFDAREACIVRDALAEIRARLAFLERVGLGYLGLDRAAPTLSGGEAQRIRLAAQLGSNLRGVCYVLDEPSIGLHPRDNRRLLDTLLALRDAGNTLVVVEHDEDTIRAADHVVDLGPGAGREGGRIVAAGSPAELAADPASITGRWLAHGARVPQSPRRPVTAADPQLWLRAVSRHNLAGFDLGLPLGRLVVLAGVSGSGKSTLMHEVLGEGLKRRLAGETATGCAGIEGWERIARVLEVDQSPIGKTPRSCPATYVGFWDSIRKLFADSFEARARGYGAARFSFNTGAGRCPVCEGQGQITVEMTFLPDVKTPCEACAGQRFNAETLAVRWRGRHVAEVLAMSVDEALAFFGAHPSIARPLALLQEVGLGYLTLGQSSATLSGGEAQRIKLVSELARQGPAPRPARGGHTLYLLDEPTVGLHRADVARLVEVLHRLAAAGHGVIVIEHDLPLIAEADWLVELGPEGGDQGGRLIAEGPPRALMALPASPTGEALRAWARQAAGMGPLSGSD